ncbi:hypothetical protein ACFQ51_38170 [Streptomyces kaempferi]
MRLLRALCATTLAALAVAGCATTPAERTAPPLPRTARDRDRLIDAAQQVLVDRCLARQGLTLRHPSDGADRRLQGALFGRGRPNWPSPSPPATPSPPTRTAVSPPPSATCTGTRSSGSVPGSWSTTCGPRPSSV